MSEFPPVFERLAIMGVGLIGGSVALAAKKQGLAGCVTGVGRDAARLAAAQQQGVIDEFSTSPGALSEADLIVVCTPVNRIADDIVLALEQSSERALVTDAGSVKGSIVVEVNRRSSAAVRYFPAHPLAGSHHTGFEHADADIFTGRLCVMTPTPGNSEAGIARVQTFWKGLGMRVRLLPADEHDRILALTSHLPHLAAAALAELVPPDHLEFAATGFRDTTRVAAGDPELWAAIFDRNTTQLTAGLDSLIHSLTSFREALVHNRSTDILNFLQRARNLRLQFRDADSQTHQSHE
jgi:prephenate dehydrogenase